MKSFAGSVFKKLMAYKALFLLLLLAIIASGYSGKFASVKNFTNILQQIAPNGIAAIGLTLVVITGGFDMSIGSVMSLTGVISMMCMRDGAGVVPAMLVGLSIGLAVGLLNGFLVAGIGINPFITTLATQTLVKGIALGITDTYPITVWNEGFATLSLGKIGSLPYSFAAVIVLAILFELYLKRTRSGHNIYICGSNREAGWSAGVNINKTLITAYAICGVTASVGGLFLASKLGSGSPVVGGDSALIAMTAIIIGGNDLNGSKANMLRTIIGILILGVLNNMMNLMGTMSYFQTLLRGVIVICVIAMDADGAKYLIAKIKALPKQVFRSGAAAR